VVAAGPRGPCQIRIACKAIFSDLGSGACHHKQRSRGGDADRRRARRSRGSTWRNGRKHRAASRGPPYLHTSASKKVRYTRSHSQIALGCQPLQVALATPHVCCGDAPDAGPPPLTRSPAPRAPCARSVLAVGSRERREQHAGGAVNMIPNFLDTPRRVQDPESYPWSEGLPLLAVCGCHAMPHFMPH